MDNQTLVATAGGNPTDSSLQGNISGSTELSYWPDKDVLSLVSTSNATYGYDIPSPSPFQVSGEAFRTRVMYCTACACVCIVFGNGLVLASMFRFAWLRNHSNYVVASFSLIAIADGLVLAPMNVIQELADLSMSSTLCKTASYTDLIVNLLCLFQLMIINGERYLAVQYPFLYKAWITTRVAVSAIAISWFMAVAIGVLVVVFLCETDNRIECNATPISGTVALCMAVFLFGLPFMIGVAIYARIYFIVRRHRAFLNSQVGCACRATGSSGLLKVIAGVFGTTLLGFGPLCTAMCMVYYVNDSTKETIVTYVLPVFILLQHVGLALNPMVYAWASPSLKTGIRKICDFKSQRGSGSRQSHQAAEFDNVRRLACRQQDPEM